MLYKDVQQLSIYQPLSNLTIQFSYLPKVHKIIPIWGSNLSQELSPNLTTQQNFLSSRMHYLRITNLKWLIMSVKASLVIKSIILHTISRNLHCYLTTMKCNWRTRLCINHMGPHNTSKQCKQKQPDFILTIFQQIVVLLVCWAHSTYFLYREIRSCE